MTKFQWKYYTKISIFEKIEEKLEKYKKLIMRQKKMNTHRVFLKMLLHLKTCIAGSYYFYFYDH